MKYSVVIEEDNLDGGYIAYVPSLKGCYTQADTLDELKQNIIEAIEISKEDDLLEIKYKKVYNISNSWDKQGSL